MKSKLVCINNNYLETLKRYLTLGKIYEYEPFFSHKNNYFIEMDNGRYEYVSKECFSTLEEWREQRINKILEKD